MKNVLQVLKPINPSVLIAKSEMFFCEVLGDLLEKEGFDVLGKATELNDLITKIKIKKPVCVIVENSLLANKTQELVSIMEQDKNKPKVIVYVNNKDAANVESILHENFSGYLHTGDRLNELYNCLKNIHIHSCYYSEGFKNFIKTLGITHIDSETWAKIKSLSKRETQILGLIAEGLGGVEIATRLGVSGRTLANQKQHIIQKLGLDSSRHLLRYALNVKQHIGYLQ